MEEKLEEISKLLKYILVVQLNKSGMVQGEIAKHLRLSKSTVNEMLKGIKRGEVNNEKNKTGQ